MVTYVVIKNEAERIIILTQNRPEIKELIQASNSKLQVVFSGTIKSKGIEAAKLAGAGCGYSFDSGSNEWARSILRGWRLDFLGRDRLDYCAGEPALVNPSLFLRK